MKLIHGQESGKKDEAGPNSDIKSKAPLLEGFGGAGRALKATVLGVSFAATLGILKTGCTFEPNGLENNDSGQDASMDAGPDADSDTDADVDAGPDADVDGGHDAGPDADVDAGPDADVDSGVDAGPDADVDGGPAACVDADVGTYSGIINMGTPQTVGGYVFEYMGKSGSDAVFKISCGGSILDADLVCPVGSETTAEDAPSGRRIRITPSAAGASVVNASITVELL